MTEHFFFLKEASSDGDVGLIEAKYELKSKVSKQLPYSPPPTCFTWYSEFKEDSLVIAQLYKENGTLNLNSAFKYMIKAE